MLNRVVQVSVRMKLSQRILFIIPAWLFLLSLSFFQATNVLAQSEDAYLKALEAEAEAIASLPLTGDEIPEPDSKQDQNTSDDKYQVQKETFEKDLQKSLPNTYTIYRKLPSEKKAIVVETYYLNEMKMPVASRQIFNFYFNDRKN